MAESTPLKLNQRQLAGNATGSYSSAMTDPLDYSGKVVLVTGSSRGLGAALATAFGQRGARCVVNYVADADGHNRTDAERVAGGLKEAVVIQCDVGDAAQVDAMMTEVQKRFAGLDILINNAAIIRDRT